MTSPTSPCQPPQNWNATIINARFIVGGGIAGVDEMAWLQRQGVTHVISAAAEHDDAALCVPDHLGYYHVPWQDDGQPKPIDDFVKLLHFVTVEEQAAWTITAFGTPDRLPRYYVHCAAGVNRGPLLATFLLAALSGMTADEAFAYIKARRPQVGSFNQPAYKLSCEAALAAVWQR